MHVRTDPDNPTRISKEYLSDDPCNVHVLWENTVLYWVRELREAGLDESHIRPDLEESAREYRQRKGVTMEEVNEKWKRRAAGEELPNPFAKKDHSDWEYD
jgi:hypothetical protein